MPRLFGKELLKRTSTEETRMSHKEELWEKAEKFVDVFHTWELLWPLDETAVKDMPKERRKAYRKARQEVLFAQDELHVIVSTIRYGGFDE